MYNFKQWSDTRVEINSSLNVKTTKRDTLRCISTHFFSLSEKINIIFRLYICFPLCPFFAVAIRLAVSDETRARILYCQDNTLYLITTETERPEVNLIS